MSDNLSALQCRLLSMLSWFDGICRDNNIRYYVIGGTMLGAMRHSGFIPWDDDVDVAIPREDYDKLENVICCNRQSQYILETVYSDEKNYCFPYSKIYDTTTTLIERTRYPLKRGIFIDVFPLDGMGNSKRQAVKIYQPIRQYYHIFLTRIAEIREERALYKNASIVVSRLLLNFLNVRDMRIKLNNMCKKNIYEDCEWIGNIFGNWGLNEVMPKSVMGTPKEYNFEGIKVFGAEYADKYLESLYGNWRQLPPVEKQVSHHDFIEFDLEKSYLD